MIRLENLSLQVGGFRLSGVSLELPTGGHGLIIGPTGSGKTTLLEAIAGHIQPTDGRIILDGRDVTRIPPEDRGIGFVYQAYHLFPHFTVRDNVGYGLQHTGLKGSSIRSRVEALAELVGITALLDRGVRGLSGGEQQRVALARALAPKPRILLLDEPFAAVDPALRRVLRRTLREIREHERITTLHVTHDVDDALRLGDMVAVLSANGIAQSGPPEQVFRYPDSPFVAEFLGAGSVLKGRLERLGPTGEGAFPARFITPDLELEVVAEREGDGHILIRPEDVLVSREAHAGPPRNRLQAQIRHLERVGPVATLHLGIGETIIFASIMTATLEEQGLHLGDRVAVGLKATAIHVF